jgi:drug/metabolite transporter (DMT)-like permease
MRVGAALVFLGVLLQSCGKVFYGTFLADVPTPLFVAVGVTLTAAVFLAIVRLRLPSEGRFTLLLLNVWTAISFISFFYALKHLPPAVFASVEIGMSLLTAVALASVQTRAWPTAIRALACLGIVTGCAVLSYAETVSIVSHPSGAVIWTAIVASVAAGIASALGIMANRKLALLGWTSRSTLAHRFYLTIVIALVWLPLEGSGLSLLGSASLALILAIAALAILIPLLLFQLAIAHTDEVSFTLCVAAQPILSFLVAIPSPAYHWDWFTLAGIVAVTIFVGLDILAKQRSITSAA